MHRLIVVMVMCVGAASADDAARVPSAERGYEILRTKAFLPADFDQATFDRLWTVWPEPLRSQALAASPVERRRMAFSRYGLMEPPEAADDYAGPALGYVPDGQAGWVMNCLSCHAGKVAGRVIPGLPNSHLALQTLTEEVRAVKLFTGKRLTHLDLGSLKIPLGETNGTTNSVVFGIALGALRDVDMKVSRTRPIPKFVHHDMDAPPFWNVKKKRSLYVDGFAPKNHRVLMQFMMIPQNDAETLRSWEGEFRDVLAWIESVEPPKYPWKIDRDLAERGRIAFERNCSRCHGTYGPDGHYEQRTIPIAEIGTDRLRFDGLAVEHRRWMKQSWLSRYGEDPVEIEPQGYVAPPLDGIWASAPYFHNGSVPTLWHVLRPDQRPVAWRRSEDGYDRERVGLDVEAFDRVPDDLTNAAERRAVFDTTRDGKSAAGHRYPDALTDDEKRAVLEYLKTL